MNLDYRLWQSGFRDMATKVLSVEALQEIAKDGMAHSTAPDKAEVLAACSLGEHSATDIGLDSDGLMQRVCLCCGEIVCCCEP